MATAPTHYSVFDSRVAARIMKTSPGGKNEAAKRILDNLSGYTAEPYPQVCEWAEAFIKSNDPAERLELAEQICAALKL